MLYRAFGENRYQFGPAAGSSAGITFEMIVIVSGLSGLRNAYRSVLSAVGSSEIAGASRWLDALTPSGPGPLRAAATIAPTASADASPRYMSYRMVSLSRRLVGYEPPGSNAPHSPTSDNRFTAEPETVAKRM